MAAGDFVEIYGPKSSSSKEESFDAILTCFFIGFGPVVVDYIETIYHALKPGGVDKQGHCCIIGLQTVITMATLAMTRVLSLREEVRHVIEHCGNCSHRHRHSPQA